MNPFVVIHHVNTIVRLKMTVDALEIASKVCQKHVHLQVVVSSRAGGLGHILTPGTFPIRLLCMVVLNMVVQFVSRIKDNMLKVVVVIWA